MPCETWDYPGKQGLYDPRYETAACGVGFVVNIDGEASAKVSRRVCMGRCELLHFD